MPRITMNIPHPKTNEEIEVEVEFDIHPAEPDVGIMSWYIEDVSIVSPEDVAAWMTSKDYDKLAERITNDYEPDDWEDVDERD